MVAVPDRRKVDQTVTTAGLFSQVRAPYGRSAEADGNRTRLTEILGHTGFEADPEITAFPQVSGVKARPSDDPCHSCATASAQLAVGRDLSAAR